MTKRIGNIFEQCFNTEALYDAFYMAQKGNTHKKDVYEFSKNLGANLHELEKELRHGTYKPGKYIVFAVYEPKRREIHAPRFRDKIVQHAMYKVLYPIFDQTFISDNYGSRKYKGTHRAADKAQEFLRKSSPESYFVQLDIRKFFYSIDRQILMTLVAKKIKDARILAMLEMFIQFPSEKGIPIGNLLSQLLSLIYLNPLDHYVKRVLKVKYYVRYMDDFVLFNLTQQQANYYQQHFAVWLADNLNLELSHWTIANVSRGINFVGFRTWDITRLLRKRSLTNFKRAVKKNKSASIISILGHARHTGSFLSLCEYYLKNSPIIDPHVERLIAKYCNIIMDKKNDNSINQSRHVFK